ncbi:Holliday junction resolvase RuvX [Candidatus Saccharibacteria bacterium]|nr:MAG: Holliday junction resolvase RuvX [Candidatus Saccharibacteria bacterium]
MQSRQPPASMAADYILGIDYGEKRVGVALMHEVAQLPRPLTTLIHTPQLLSDIQLLIEKEHVSSVVVGVPRNMDGSESTQSQECEAFARRLGDVVNVPVYTTDETLSSEEAEAALRAIGKAYTKSDIDAMSAALILERYREEQGGAYDV